MSRPRVLLADDHRILVDGLRGLLADQFELLGVVDNGNDLVTRALELRPDVILADIVMPGLNGIEALQVIKRQWPEVRMVFLTMHSNPAYVRRALAAGCVGFVPKHVAQEELVQALTSVCRGETYLASQLLPAAPAASTTSPAGLSDLPPALAALTARQCEVLRLIVEGCSAKQIAARLGISNRTAEFHKYEIMQTLGLKTSAELIALAAHHGFDSPGR